MKVLIVSPCTLPVPSVHGGAVQQLIDSIIKENEKRAGIDLVVAGLWDADAAKESMKYKKTQFLFWKEPVICRLIDNTYEWFYTRVLRKNHRTLKLHARKLYVISRIIRELKENDYDHVIFENMGYQLKALDNKDVENKYKGKIWFHIHNDIPDNIDVNNLKKVRLLMISSYLGKKVKAKCGDAAPQMHVVKNGIDFEKFNKPQDISKTEYLRTKFGIAKDKKIILFVGRIIPEKGVEQVIDAYLSIGKELNAVLLIVGSLNFNLERTSDFEKRIREKSEKAEGGIIFTGFVPQVEVVDIYRMADVAVLPSIWEEPAGLTMLEAAAAGAPVVTTNAGGIPEYLMKDMCVFLDRNDALVENIEKSIKDVCENRKEWKSKTQLAKEYVKENFSEARFYDSFLDTVQGRD